MTTFPINARAVLSLLGLVALAGCATLDDDLPAHKPPERHSATAATSIDHGPGLRCMDDLLLDYGTPQLAVIVEDLADPARKTTGTKHLLINAASDMSMRSRAIRVVAQGAEPGSASTLSPQYLLRGSLSRPDEKTLAVDLMVVTTQDGTVVPGVTSRKQASGAPGDQALRPLVEGTTIEVFGRLARVPYWTCLGQRDDDPAVSAAIRDWYDVMVARPKDIIEYFQSQLRLRGAYAGPVDGAVNPQFNDAVARYREALGLSREPKLTKDFLQAYLGANHRELKAKVAPAASAPVAAQPPTLAAPRPAPPTTTKPLAAAPLALRVGAANDAREFGRGEPIRLNIRPSRDAHVYCFLQDENRQISRFFPNRFQPDSRVNADAGLQLPGAMRFEIRMNSKGAKETVACFATERDVLPALPAALAASDFKPLPVASLDELRRTLSQAARGAVAHESFEVRPK